MNKLIDFDQKHFNAGHDHYFPDRIDNLPSFSCNRFGTPGKVSSIKTQCSILFVATAASYGVDSLLSKLGHSSWSSKFELTLVPDWGTFASGCPAFMQMIT